MILNISYNVTRGRGIGRASSKGRGGRSVDHSDCRIYSESKEKLQKNTPSIRGVGE